jgi:hypothetical protein
MTNPTRQAAAGYLARGFRPIPMWGVTPDGRCRCGGTECNAGKHCTDETEKRWKDGAPFRETEFGADQNIALALGPWRAGKWLVCLDIDGAKHPNEVPEIARHVTPTLTQASPRGLHLFYWVPEFTPLGNWVDAFQSKYRLGYAVDVRYARGKVNVSPSRTAFGTYTWQDPAAEVSQLPWPIIDRILDERRRRKLPVLSRWQRDGKRA